MKLLFNALYQSVPSLDVEVIMRLETTRLQDDLLNDVAVCGIAPPPSPKIALSRFQATLLQIMVIILLHLLNQNSHHQLKYVSHSRQYSAHTKCLCTERGLSRKYSNHFGDVAVTSSSILNI